MTLAGPPGGEAAARTREVQRMFGAIAPTYDRLNRLLSFGVDRVWRRALAAHTPSHADRVLDLACGTCDVALEVSRARPGARVFGADFSIRMLQAARPKIRATGKEEQISLQAASAEDLPYRDRVFDAVTMAFGIRNVSRRERALREIFRVLSPGGCALILDFSLPENPVIRAAYGVYFHRVLPLLGGLVSGSFQAYRYLPKSVAGFPPRTTFTSMLKAQGFESVGWEDFTLGIVSLYRAVRP